MIETRNIMNTQLLAGAHTGSAEGAGDEYYRAYYRALVSKHASRAERNRRLENIKAERRRARREKWLKTAKSPASVLISSEAMS
jgi:hypothetical protein